MRNWTDAQRAAIDIDGRTVVVSAGAGSGKTAVLTERITKKIKEGSRDISDIAVVTFTKAAAAELRERIYSALAGAIAENPKNKRLSKQFLEIGNARISTVDSFCYDLLKENAVRCGLSKGVRIADSAEIALIKSNVMNDLIDDCYDTDGRAAKIEDFSAFIENFVKLTDEQIAETFIKLSDDLGHYEEGTEILAAESDLLEKIADKKADIFDGPFGAVLRKNLIREFSSYEILFTKAVYEVEHSGICEGYLPSFGYFRDFAAECTRIAKKESGTAFYSHIKSYEKPANGKAKAGEKTELMEFFSELRKEFDNAVNSVSESFIIPLANDGKSLYSMTASVCRKLSQLLHEYEERLWNEKKKRGIIDFADVERLALGLLSDPAYAADAASSFKEMYIDEYQDINKLQDGIFRRIADAGVARFMVGDLKQCIYAFRGAVPELFANYRSSFEKYSADKSDYTDVSVFLSNNFRCDKPIVDFVNAVCGVLFPHGSGKVPYVTEDALVYSKLPDESRKPKNPEIILIDEKNAPKELGFTEEAYVARRIKKLIDGGRRPGDIAILLRSAKSAAAGYEKELSALGISSTNAAAENFFETPEILLMLSLLHCIDNPAKDIHLAAVLKSPLFGVTVEELCRIKREGGGRSLYASLLAYTEKTAA